MRFPVYPEPYRKGSLFVLKIRWYLLASFIIGWALFWITLEMEPDNYTLIVIALFLGIAGLFFFATFNAPDELILAEIREDGIHILDHKGDPYRSVEYRYVRNVEVRTLYITQISSVNAKPDYGSSPSIKATVIMAYINNAFCFEDLNLEQLRWKGENAYWCDKIFHHYNCFAFVYNEEAWNLLQAQLAAHAAGNQ